MQDEVVAPVRLAGPGPVVDVSQQLDDERTTYRGFRWWPVDDIEAGTGRFYPGRLPALLRNFLARNR